VLLKQKLQAANGTPAKRSHQSPIRQRRRHGHDAVIQWIEPDCLSV
jgi:hypothetical protein